MAATQPAKCESSIVAQMLMSAVETGDARKVKTLLEVGADADAALDNGETALIRAALRGYTDVVKVLLEAGANINPQRDQGLTALIAAMLSGHSDIVRLLLEKGVDISKAASDSTTARKLAEWIAARGFGELAALLRDAEAASITRHVTGAANDTNVAATEVRETYSNEGANTELCSSAADTEDFARSQDGENFVTQVGTGEPSSPETLHPEGDVQLEEPELFPQEGPFEMVVPLAKVDEPDASATPADNQQPTDDVAASGSSPDEQETLITPRTSPASGQHNNPAARLEPLPPSFAVQLNETLHSWPAVSTVLIVFFASTVMMFTIMRNKKQPAIEQPNQPFTNVDSQLQQTAPSVMPAQPASERNEQAGMTPVTSSSVPADTAMRDVPTPTQPEPIQGLPAKAPIPANAKVKMPQNRSEHSNTPSPATVNSSSRHSKGKIVSDTTPSPEVKTGQREAKVISARSNKQENERQSVFVIPRVAPQTTLPQGESLPPPSAPVPSAPSKTKKVIQWP